jgi:hypothetical protein
MGRWGVITKCEKRKKRKRGKFREWRNCGVSGWVAKAYGGEWWPVSDSGW